MGLSSLEQSVLLTVAYTDQFQFPLTAAEVMARLIQKVGEGWKLELAGHLSLHQIGLALKNLVRKGYLETQTTHYFLPGRQAIGKIRLDRRQTSRLKLIEIETLVQFAQSLPWVSAIYLTGSLAMSNAVDAADADFMIITQPGRLWLVRVLMSLFALVHGKRRAWHGEEQRSWCFNLWLESDQFELFAQHPSIYVAYELTQARVLLDKEGVGERLIAATPWVTEYLPRSAWMSQALEQREQKRNILVASHFWDSLNDIAFILQYRYMKPHITRELVTKKSAFFHPRDTQTSVMDGWIKSLKLLN